MLSVIGALQVPSPGNIDENDLGGNGSIVPAAKGVTAVGKETWDALGFCCLSPANSFSLALKSIVCATGGGVALKSP